MRDLESSMNAQPAITRIDLLLHIVVLLFAAMGVLFCGRYLDENLPVGAPRLVVASFIAGPIAFGALAAVLLDLPSAARRISISAARCLSGLALGWVSFYLVVELWGRFHSAPYTVRASHLLENATSILVGAVVAFAVATTYGRVTARPKSHTSH